MPDDQIQTDYQPDPVVTTRESAALTEQEGATALARALAVEGKPRDPATQRFIQKDTAAKEPQKAPVVDIKTGKPADKPQIGHNGGPELEADEFFEWPAEKEGEEPRRVKADEVFAAFDELPKVRAELEKATRERAVTAPEVEATVIANMEVRSKMLQDLSMLARVLRPEQPDPRAFANNPEAYREAMAEFQSQVGALKRVEDEHKRLLGEQTEASRIVARATAQRAEREIIGFWPEMGDPKTAINIIDTAAQLTGFTRDEIMSTVEPRMWRVLKGFMEHEAAKSKQVEAAKVVRAKPKLVKGGARSSTSPTERAAGAFEALARTGSEEDGARALSLLLSDK